MINISFLLIHAAQRCMTSGWLSIVALIKWSTVFKCSLSSNKNQTVTAMVQNLFLALQLQAVCHAQLEETLWGPPLNHQMCYSETHGHVLNMSWTSVMVLTCVTSQLSDQIWNQRSISKPETERKQSQRRKRLLYSSEQVLSALAQLATDGLRM